MHRELEIVVLEFPASTLVVTDNLKLSFEFRLSSLLFCLSHVLECFAWSLEFVMAFSTYDQDAYNPFHCCSTLLSVSPMSLGRL